MQLARGRCKKQRMKCSFSGKIVECLKLKVKKHNESHATHVTLQQLIRVYKRGERITDSIFRPAKTNAQWAIARVNMFMRMVAGQTVADAYKLQDQDIIKGSHITHEQEIADPFLGFTEGDYISARCDLLLAHVTDVEANKLFLPPSMEELEQ